MYSQSRCGGCSRFLLNDNSSVLATHGTPLAQSIDCDLAHYEFVVAIHVASGAGWWVLAKFVCSFDVSFNLSELLVQSFKLF